MIEKMTEMASGIKEQARERISSPLAGAFFISWCVWNYQFLLVLLGDMDSSYKISYIENNLYCHGWADVLTLFFGPLITAMGYILLYPVIGKFFYAYSRKHQNILKGLKQQIDGESLLSEEDAKKLRTEVIRATNNAASATRDQEHMLAENERLEKEIVALQKQLNELKISKVREPEIQNSSPNNLESDEEKMVEVLTYIGHHEKDHIERSILVDQFSKTFNKVILDHILDKLQESGLIKSSTGYYSITKQGRTLLVDLNNA